MHVIDQVIVEVSIVKSSIIRCTQCFGLRFCCCFYSRRVRRGRAVLFVPLPQEVFHHLPKGW